MSGTSAQYFYIDFTVKNTTTQQIRWKAVIDLGAAMTQAGVTWALVAVEDHQGQGTELAPGGCTPNSKIITVEGTTAWTTQLLDPGASRPFEIAVYQSTASLEGHSKLWPC